MLDINAEDHPLHAAERTAEIALHHIRNQPIPGRHQQGSLQVVLHVLPAVEADFREIDIRLDAEAANRGNQTLADRVLQGQLRLVFSEHLLQPLLVKAFGGRGYADQVSGDKVLQDAPQPVSRRVMRLVHDDIVITVSGNLVIVALQVGGCLDKKIFSQVTQDTV